MDREVLLLKSDKVTFRAIEHTMDNCQARQWSCHQDTPRVPPWVFVSGLVFFQLKGFREDLATAGKCAGMCLEQIGQSLVRRGGRKHTSLMIYGWSWRTGSEGMLRSPNLPCLYLSCPRLLSGVDTSSLSSSI